MQALNTTSLTLQDNRLWILDQQALPQEKRWRACDSVEELVGHIHSLRVRGAPLIGLSASLLLALLAERGLPRAGLEQALHTLRAARPTAVNLMNNLDRMKLALAEPDWVPAMVNEALRLVEEDRRLCDRIADHGAGLVKPGSRLLTHCNTGGLATAGVGTAIGVLLRAHRQGKVQQVWVDETRPLLQGGRLTARELGELGIPYRLICDAMAASLMAQGQSMRCGSARIASPPTVTSPTKSAPTAGGAGALPRHPVLRGRPAYHPRSALPGRRRHSDRAARGGRSHRRFRQLRRLPVGAERGTGLQSGVRRYAGQAHQRMGIRQRRDYAAAG